MIKRIFKICKSKYALTAMALIYTFAMVMGGTFSWITSSDTALNQFETGRLSTQISETFIGTEQWRPGQTVGKLIKVRNTGDSESIVRVSLNEFLLSFEYDLAKGGSGNLRVFKSAATVVVDRRFPATWATGQTYEAGASAYYKAATAVSALEFGMDVAQRTDNLQYFTVVFGDHVYDSTTIASKPPAVTDYWYFENGWFYYSRVLSGIDTLTEPLVKAVKMANEVSYNCQSSLYAMTVIHEAITPYEDALTDWTANGLSTGGNAYNFLVHAVTTNS